MQRDVAWRVGNGGRIQDEAAGGCVGIPASTGMHACDDASQITKHYLPLERDPLLAPEQREVVTTDIPFLNICHVFYPSRASPRTTP